jgi:glycosyltransferase involved in cell wall biosynthesis
MRILYVIGSLELGGAEQHLLRVTRELARRGWKPEVFALTTGGTLSSAFAEAGVPIHGTTLPSWVAKLLRNERAIAWASLLVSMATLWLLYWRKRPHATHFFLPSAYIVGGLASMLGPPMYRLMSRRSLNHYQAKHRLFTKVEHWLHPRMDVASGNSRAVMMQLREEGFSASKLRLIYNGLDTSTFRACKGRAEVRAELDVGDYALMFVMVANLIPYKGHADLINAFALIQEQLPAQWVCICVGRDDGIQKQLTLQADSAKIRNNIRFIGSRKDVPNILQAADIGVLCSHQEGFSNAVIESMAAGLPLVVTDVGGNSEAVSDNETGYVVASQRPDELGQALLNLALDESRRASFGKAGKARVDELFSLSSCVDNYIEMYQSLRQPKFSTRK